MTTTRRGFFRSMLRAGVAAATLAYAPASLKALVPAASPAVLEVDLGRCERRVNGVVVAGRIYLGEDGKAFAHWDDGEVENLSAPASRGYSWFPHGRSHWGLQAAPGDELRCNTPVEVIDL